MRPKRILLMRHGEAEGNVDQTLFQTKPDHLMTLTPRGIIQARTAGDDIRRIIGLERIRVYLSPYLRTRQTFRELGIRHQVDMVIDEPRLREQDWGNFQHGDRILEQKRQRADYGHFIYRLQHGESGADVFDRVSAFMDTLFRGFGRPGHPPNVLIVTHGLTMRLFMMRWFHWSVEYFESLENPRPGELKILTDGPGGYDLDRAFRQWKTLPPDDLYGELYGDEGERLK